MNETMARLHALADASGSRPGLRELASAGLDQLPLPGAGQTLLRWRMLAEVAALDLSLAKLYEGHTDAMAILAELSGPSPEAGSLWGTWCAEPPDARVQIRGAGTGAVRLNGRKSWCSGAAEVSHALVSGWTEDGKPWLAAVALRQAGVRVTREGWPAVGMAASGSVDVVFEDAEATAVGAPGDYLSRPGFWQGGGGIAACWFGGAAGIARTLRARCANSSDAHRLAHLGAVEAALRPALALLRETAAWIDAHPQDSAQTPALTLRLAVEAAAQQVLQHASRALGAGPLCRDERLARAVADLPIYLRQSHAERDLESLGRQLAEANDKEWLQP
ncbi:acyl-CoA dehydrogenase [Variovorax sp. OV329]|uniref:acyl-CoA dehydrogenase n=1 Tax=Variovorax sp. OV329 TaxID=1882825 RepID=UPI0008F31A9E|nr:acyl-CoA dehydrogenase [Variovorax sp. OV329]SFN39779.1 Acyl-CoA dehydrogenase [Variovorax sp. OV329]